MPSSFHDFASGRIFPLFFPANPSMVPFGFRLGSVWVPFSARDATFAGAERFPTQELDVRGRSEGCHGSLSALLSRLSRMEPGEGARRESARSQGRARA